MRPARVKPATESSSNLNEGPFTLPFIDEGGYYLISFGVNGGVEITARDKGGYESKGASAFFSSELDLIKAFIGYLSMSNLSDLDTYVGNLVLSRQTSAQSSDLASKVQLAR